MLASLLLFEGGLLYAINLIFLTRNETMRSLLKISWG